MSLKFAKKSNANKFDTVELIPSAENYGAPSTNLSHQYLFSAETIHESDVISPTNKSKNGIDTVFDSDGHHQPSHSPLGDKSDTHGEDSPIDVELDHHESEAHAKHKAPSKFGTFDGVLGRCLLCMVCRYT